MATSSIRHIDQENAHVIKGGDSHPRARFGPSKSFQTNGAPLATPRRALGDLGNLNFDSKPKSFVKPFTDGSTHIRSSTGATSARKSHKKRSVSKRVATVKKEAADSSFPEKENMFPFRETETKPQPSEYVNTIINNVHKLYHGCLRQFPQSSEEEAFERKLDFGFELERRPFQEEDIPFPSFEDTDNVVEDSDLCTIVPLPDLDCSL